MKEGDHWDHIPEELNFEKESEQTNVLLHPISSFSTDKEIATSFARASVTQKAARFIITSIVPKERVFSIPETGSGCLDEEEVVVLGGVINSKVEKYSVYKK
jgi:hypothetical protein